MSEEDLEEVLCRIADFTSGYGDVAGVVNRMARDALREREAEEGLPWTTERYRDVIMELQVKLGAAERERDAARSLIRTLLDQHWALFSRAPR